MLLARLGKSHAVLPAFVLGLALAPCLERATDTPPSTRRCTKPGELSALLRRGGLYSSHLSAWRAARHNGELAGAGLYRRRVGGDRRMYQPGPRACGAGDGA